MRVAAALSSAAVLAAGCALAPRHDPAIRAGLGHFGEPDPSVVRTARLSIVCEEPERAVREAEALARVRGGYVERASEGSAILRIPNARLDDLLEALVGLGDVRDREVRAEDFAVHHRDLAVRLDNLERARARYLQLLARATDVAGAITVERELERVTLEIERLQAARALLESRIARATVEVHFASESGPGPVGWLLYGAYYAVRWLFVWD
ncbi:MAG: DUF4349 domain-containing protein [Planctomycetales bacterium]|nr:DUF4349 domain-containing protein [Planctomycetales bacterium]